MDRQFVETNDIRLNVIQDGPEDGPLMLLLHGFPEFSLGWRKQVPAFASAGYRVWAPDQRGYNLSDKPDSMAAYNLDELADDVIGLIDASGREQAFLVGHDWGGSVAWWVAARYPDRLKKLVILNVPHGAVMQRNLRRNLTQIRKSWYMFFYQLPWLPEALGRRRNWKMLVDALTHTSRPGTFSASDLDQYRQAWSQPKAFRSMLNWYRAMMQKPPKAPPRGRIRVPTLMIWGAKDRFLGREMAQPSVDLCKDGRLVFIEDATHWVQHEEAERVNELILAFVQETA